MAERSVVVRLRAEVADFQRKMKTAAASATEPGAKAAESADKLTTQMGLIGAAVTVGVASAVKKFADFDQAMSAVAATGDDARQSIEALRAAAITAGAETAFSATEAAEGIEQLAKAGISAKDILGGGLDGALALAASDNLELGAAAEYTATAMNQFNLAGNQATHVADLLAAGAGKAMGGVDDMGMALKQAGLVASGMGLTIEETTGSLAAFAQQGLLGSDAGTSFKSMLQRLANPTKESAELMKQLGINAYDASGNFVGMSELAGQLQYSLGHLTSAQRDAALAQIFGADAVRAARVVYDEGAAGIQRWTEAVDDQGFAAEQAATKLNNLKGDWEEFTGSLETAMIGAGEGANGPLRNLVQSATGAVNAFTALHPAIQQSTLLIAGAGGLGLLGTAALLKLASTTREGLAAMVELGVVSERTAGRVGKMSAGLAKAGGLAAGLWALAAGLDAISSSGDKAAAGVEATEKALRGIQGAGIEDLFAGLGPDVNNLAEGFDLLFDGGIDGKLERFGSGLNAIFFGGQLSDQVKDTKEQFANLGEALAQMVGAGDAQEAALQFEQIAAAAERKGYSLEQVQSLMPAYTEALASQSIAQEEAASAVQVTTASVEDQVEALEAQNDAMLTAAGQVLSLRDAQRQLAEAEDAATAALEKNGATLDINTAEGRENQAALDGVASSGLAVAESLLEQGASADAIRGSIQSTRDKFVSLAGSMGMSDDEANALADSLGLIPGEYTAVVTAETGAARTDADRIRSYIDGLEAAIGVGARWKGQAQVNAIRNLIQDQTVSLGVYADKPRYMGGIVGYAEGGLLGGTPPANPHQDNLLAATVNGSRVSLRSGEFIQSEPAVQHYGVAFMAALNARRIPKNLLTGYASGGHYAPRGYAPPTPAPTTAGAPAAPVFSVAVDASGLIDGDVARTIAARTERKLMDAYHTYGLGQVESGVAV